MAKIVFNEDEELVSPIRYKHGDIDCWTAMESAFGRDAVIDFDLGNVLKYLWRSMHKGNRLQDLKKAGVYINHAIKLIEAGEKKDLSDDEKFEIDKH